MDSIDKQILNVIQKDFPVVEEPFKAVADKVRLSEDEVLKRIKNLKEEGITLARRTVAKYRDTLKILPTHLRKQRG